MYCPVDHSWLIIWLIRQGHFPPSRDRLRRPHPERRGLGSGQTGRGRPLVRWVRQNWIVKIELTYCVIFIYLSLIYLLLLIHINEVTSFRRWNRGIGCQRLLGRPPPRSAERRPRRGARRGRRLCQAGVGGRLPLAAGRLWTDPVGGEATFNVRV